MPETESEPKQPNGGSQPKQPRAKGLRKFWPFGRRKAQPISQEAQEFKRKIDKEAEKNRPAVQSKEIREILLERRPININEILEVVGRLDYKDFRYLELARKYGEGTLGKFKAFLAGEYDFGIDQHNTIGWNACAEAGRKVLYTLFNRRTIAATGMAAVLGILTGGVGAVAGGVGAVAGSVGAAAGGVIFGSMAGRGTAEAISAITGKERGAREKVLIKEKERWYELKRLADELQKTEDVQKRADLMSQITDLYFKQGENVVLKQLQLANEKFESEKQGLNKLRNRLQTLGEIVGVGAGIAHGFLTGHFASIDIDLWRKVKGQSLMHEVVKINDTWHFVFNEATKAGSTHVLGEPAWKIGAATFAERGLPVLLAAFSAAVFGGRYERKAEAEYQARQAVETRRPNPGDLFYAERVQFTDLNEQEGVAPNESYAGRFEVQNVQGDQVTIKLLDDFNEAGPTNKTVTIPLEEFSSSSISKGPYRKAQREQGFSEEGFNPPAELAKSEQILRYKKIIEQLNEWESGKELYVVFQPKPQGEAYWLPEPLANKVVPKKTEDTTSFIKVSSKPDFRLNQITLEDETKKQYPIRLTLFLRWVDSLNPEPCAPLKTESQEDNKGATEEGAGGTTTETEIKAETGAKEETETGAGANQDNQNNAQTQKNEGQQTETGSKQ